MRSNVYRGSASITRACPAIGVPPKIHRNWIRVRAKPTLGMLMILARPAMLLGVRCLWCCRASFLPKRTDAGGVIKWTKQSELNNAGFNLLRSETRNGKLVVINAIIIPGAGTSGEKHTYNYTDKSAKPNVAHYYRIEDVSFAGARRTITTARLHDGHLSPAGKVPVLWYHLKQPD